MVFFTFPMPKTRWIGVTPGCLDPLQSLWRQQSSPHDKAAELAGGMNQTADMEWLMSDKEDLHTGVLIWDLAMRC